MFLCSSVTLLPQDRCQDDARTAIWCSKCDTEHRPVDAQKETWHRQKNWSQTAKKGEMDRFASITTTGDHLSDASSIEPELELSADTVSQQPLKLLSPIAEEKEPTADDIVNVLHMVSTGPCHSTPKSRRFKRSLSFAEHVSASKRLRRSPVADNEELEEPARNDSHTSIAEQALQLLASVAQASESSVPVQAGEDNDGTDLQTIRDGRKLTDVDIDAFQCLVHSQCAHINGLQSPLLSQCEQFKRCTQGPMIQVLYEATRAHWVLVATQECKGDNVVVDVYDTVFKSIAEETMDNICALVEAHATVTVRLVNVQRQRGSTDCGIFVCAFMERLANGKDVCGVSFNAQHIRHHLVQCLINKELNPFPVVCESRVPRQQFVQEKTVYVVCACRKRWKGELVVECSGCKLYFHPSCATIDECYWDSSKLYFCTSCL